MIENPYRHLIMRYNLVPLKLREPLYACKFIKYDPGTVLGWVALCDGVVIVDFTHVLQGHSTGTRLCFYQTGSA